MTNSILRRNLLGLDIDSHQWEQDPKPPRTCGEATVDTLGAHYIDTRFRLPSVQNDRFYNALIDRCDHIEVIHARHDLDTAITIIQIILTMQRCFIEGIAGAVKS